MCYQKEKQSSSRVRKTSAKPKFRSAAHASRKLGTDYVNATTPPFTLPFAPAVDRTLRPDLLKAFSMTPIFASRRKPRRVGREAETSAPAADDDEGTSPLTESLRASL